VLRPWTSSLLITCVNAPRNIVRTLSVKTEHQRCTLNFSSKVGTLVLKFQLLH
jgi:hypothetical protein